MPYVSHLMKKDGTMQAGGMGKVELPADVDWQSVADKSKRVIFVMPYQRVVTTGSKLTKCRVEPGLLAGQLR